MTGVKGKSGRKKSPTKQYIDALELLRGDAPQLVGSLKRLALGEPIKCQHCGELTDINKVDREAAIYLLDRVYGKPKATAEIDLNTKFIPPGEILQLIKIARQANTELLDELKQAYAEIERLKGDPQRLPGGTVWEIR